MSEMLRVPGSLLPLRMAISFARHRKYANALKHAAKVANTTASTTTTKCGPSLVENCSSNTPPASNANAVRIHAKNVRSFASENR